jgi:hypothetical protein
MGELVNLADRRAAVRPSSAPEQLDRAAFVASLVKPASEWLWGMARVRLADFTAEAAFWRHRVTCDENGKESDASKFARAVWKQADQERNLRIGEQLFVAAPTVAALRWKEKVAGSRMCKEVGEALDRDTKRRPADLMLSRGNRPARCAPRPNANAKPS